MINCGIYLMINTATINLQPAVLFIAPIIKQCHKIVILRRNFNVFLLNWTPDKTRLYLKFYQRIVPKKRIWETTAILEILSFCYWISIVWSNCPKGFMYMTNLAFCTHLLEEHIFKEFKRFLVYRVSQLQLTGHRDFYVTYWHI